MLRQRHHPLTDSHRRCNAYVFTEIALAAGRSAPAINLYPNILLIRRFHAAFISISKIVITCDDPVLQRRMRHPSDELGHRITAEPAGLQSCRRVGTALRGAESFRETSVYLEYLRWRSGAPDETEACRSARFPLLHEIAGSGPERKSDFRRLGRGRLPGTVFRLETMVK